MRLVYTPNGYQGMGMGKTAAALTEKERSRYRDLARLRAARARRQEQARRQRALMVAREAACVLKESFGVTKVLLHGSLATGGPFHLRSDIDLAVDGLRPVDFWRADCRLESVGGDFEIDLLDLRMAPPGFVEAVLRDGMEL